MLTVLTYKDKEVCIGPDRPFVMIGERINPTRRLMLASSMSDGDFSRVKRDAVEQVHAGAQVLDINANVHSENEPALLLETVKAVLDVVDIPLCFDSANPDALKAVLEFYPGKALINSTTAEASMMDIIFPLAKEYGAAVIGVITDESGIPETPIARLKAANKLIDKATSCGIRMEDVIIDPLASTVGADHLAAQITLETIRLIRKELEMNICLGASNVSFGLPDRKHINSTYLAMAIVLGLTAAITDPTKEEIRTTALASDLLMGRDEYSMNWLQEYRKRSQGT